MRTNSFICIFLVIITSMSGCYEHNVSLKSLGLKRLKFKPLENIKEYVSRIGKKLLIVRIKSETLSPQVNFEVNSAILPQMNINLSSSNNIANIIISKGLIDYLENEAELAAIIAISIEMLEHNDFCSYNLDYNSAADLRIIHHLARAGYDPNFLASIEKEYLHSSKNKNWLNSIFWHCNITPARITMIEKNLNKISPGLQHNRENFLNNIYLFSSNY